MTLRAGFQAGLLNQSSAQVIDGSLKFDGSKSQYLKRTLSASNRKTWTWSAWLKRDKFADDNTYHILFSTRTSNSNRHYVAYNADVADELFTYDHTNSNNKIAQTNAKYRDTGWYHVVVIYDNTRSNGGERLRFFINGVENDSWGSYQANGATHEGLINSNTEHRIGGDPNAPGYFYGSMSQVYFIDGVGLGPGYFGFTDPLTGTWRPKKFESEGTTVNDGTQWSSYMSNTSGAGNLFDGDTSTAYGPDGNTQTFTPPNPIIVQSSLRIYYSSGVSSRNFEVNDNGNVVATGTGTKWVDLNFTGPLVKISGSNGWNVRAIEVDGVIMKDNTTQKAGFNIAPASGPIYSDFGYGDFTNAAVNAFDGSTSTKAEPNDNDTVYFDFSHVNPTGTLLNYDSNSRLPTYLNQGGLAAGDGLRNNPIYHAFDGSNSTYCDMTYSNGNYSRLIFENPITNVTNITLGYDGEGDPGYNGGNHQTSTSYNGSRQSIQIYNGSAITLNNLDFISRPGNGVCRLYDVTITTSSQSATKLTLDGGVSVSSGLRMYMAKAGSPGANHFTVNGTSLGGSISSGWNTINSVSKLKNIALYHQSGSSSVELYAVEVDSSILTDGDPASGGNSFYLPMDGNSPIGEDKSGNGNDFTPVNLGNSNSLEKATGALPILNTLGGTVARPGVFGSEESSTIAVTVSDGTGSNKYYLDGVLNPSLSFIRGATITFDTTDSSNGSHPFKLSSTNADSSSGTEYTDGVVYYINGSIVSGSYYQSYYSSGASSGFRGIKWTIPHDVSTTYYYCTAHSGMGENGRLTSTTDETKADPYAWKNTLALPLVGNDDDVSNKINSGSTTKVVTANGNAAASATQSNFYGSSYYFDGTDDKLTIPNNTDFNFGSGDSTIEMWVYPTRISGTQENLITRGTSGYSGFIMSVKNFLDSTNGGSSWNVSITYDNPLVANVWQHIAVCRSGDTWTVYINGVANGSATASGTVQSSAETLTIGERAGQTDFQGYINDIRLYKGVAKYTSNFIPASTSPDILPDTPSGVSGGSKLTKITDGAVSFDGNGDSLVCADSADWDFGTGDFTIECFAYFNDTTSTNSTMINRWTDIWTFQIVSSTQNLRFYAGASDNLATASNTIGPNKWYHFAASRSSGTLKLFIDGVESASSSFTKSLSGSTPLNIGAENSTQSLPTNGHISNVRIVNGTALYTKNFTPPSAPLTNVTNTKLLCCQSNTQLGAAAVSPNVSGINNGTQWSSYLTVSDSFTSSGRAAGFDGSTSTYSQPNANSSSITWAPAGGITYSTSVEVYTYQSNGVFTTVSDGAQSVSWTTLYQGWKTIASGGGTFTSTTLTSGNPSASDSRPTFAAVRVDGTILVDPLTPNGDAAATNFNPFTTDINAVRGQEGAYATLNLHNKHNSNNLLSDGNLKFTSSGNDATLTESTIAMSSGKFYFEVVYSGSQGTGQLAGIRKPNARNYNDSYIYVGTGNKYTDGGSSASYGATLANGDVIGTAYDADNGTLEFFKNGTSQGIAFTGITGTYAFLVGSFGSTPTGVANFGQKPFKFPPPEGFQPLNGTNLIPETVIARPDKYVVATTYTGNGTSQTVSTPNMKPDFVWIKNRDENLSHFLYDSVRGANMYLRSDTLNAQDSGSSNQLSFAARGFTLSGAGGGVNKNNIDFASWSWKAGGNKGVFNVDDEGYANASDVNMSISSLNSTVYNTSNRWSDDYSGATIDSSYPITQAFDGNRTTASRVSATETAMSVDLTSITVADKIEVKGELGYITPYVSVTVDGAIHLLGGDPNTLISGSAGTTSRVITGVSGALTNVTVGRVSSGRTFLSQILVDGKILVDDNITPPNAPSIANIGASVGTRQGFSIIKYAGSGSNGSIAHGLNQAPDFFFGRDIEDTGESRDWIIYHKSIGATGRVKFTTGAESISSAFFQNIEPTNKLITVGTSNDINSTNDYVLYCWHDVPGLQKFGSYINPSSSDGAFVEVGFKPAIIIFKCVRNISSSSGAGDWVIMDTTRNPVNNPSDNNTLVANVSNGEDSYYNANQAAVDILSNGFKIRHPNSSPGGDPGRLYIYAAWADAPSFNLYGGQSNAR